MRGPLFKLILTSKGVRPVCSPPADSLVAFGRGRCTDPSPAPFYFEFVTAKGGDRPGKLPGRPFLTTRDAAVLAVLCAEPPPAAAIQLKLERLRRRGLAGKRRRHGVRYYKKSA